MELWLVVKPYQSSREVLISWKPLFKLFGNYKDLHILRFEHTEDSQILWLENMSHLADISESIGWKFTIHKPHGRRILRLLSAIWDFTDVPKVDPFFNVHGGKLLCWDKSSQEVEIRWRSLPHLLRLFEIHPVEKHQPSGSNTWSDWLKIFAMHKHNGWGIWRLLPAIRDFGDVPGAFAFVLMWIVEYC